MTIKKRVVLKKIHIFTELKMSRKCKVNDIISLISLMISRIFDEIFFI